MRRAAPAGRDGGGADDGAEDGADGGANGGANGGGAIDDTHKTRSAPMRLLFNAAHLYRLRVREQPLQELLALLGIAAGVALLFAVQVASSSVTESLRQLAHGVTGKATLEISARGPGGMDQSIVAKAQRLDGVQGVAPVVQQRIVVNGPAGTVPLTLIGVDQRVQKIGGPLVRRFVAKRKDLDSLGFYLTAPTARSIGVRPGDTMTIESGALKRRILLAGTLSADEIGDLAKTPVALAPLGMAQRIADMPGRVSRVLVQPTPGTDAIGRLQTLAAERADVRASDAEVDLLAEAMKPDQKSSAVFSVVAVVIGLLFAYNAMLLVMTQRRRQVAYLRMIGADRATVLATLAFAALALGVTASVIGVVLGDLLSRVAFASVPQYLASGFMIGEQRVVAVGTIVLSIAGGMAAALLASAKPAYDVMNVDPATAAHDQDVTVGPDNPIRRSKSLWLGLALGVVVSPLVMLVPALTPVAIVVVIVTMALLLNPFLRSVLRVMKRTTRARGGVGLSIAVDELNAGPVRATALALIAAGAVMATLSLGGSRLDLERGVHALTSDYFHGGELWISPVDKTNVYSTRPFDPHDTIERLRGQRGIESVTAAGWSFLDVAGRRVLTVAPPGGFRSPVVRSQVLKGDPDQASARIRAGGWVTMSTAIANELGSRLGQFVVIPTPTGNRRYRLAAVTANHGWPSGCIIMNRGDYRKAWQSDAATALSVNLKPGTSLSDGERIVSDALGEDSALSVKTADAMVAERSVAFSQGLARLRQISGLVLGASILAIVAAMSAGVWQRRLRLASMRAIGMNRGQVYRSLLAESGLVVLIGGVGGVVFGLYGQFFASRWLVSITGFQTVFEPAISLGFFTLTKAVALATLATIGPAYLATRIAPRAGEPT